MSDLAFFCRHAWTKRVFDVVAFITPYLVFLHAHSNFVTGTVSVTVVLYRVIDLQANRDHWAVQRRDKEVVQ